MEGVWPNEDKSGQGSVFIVFLRTSFMDDPKRILICLVFYCTTLYILTNPFSDLTAVLH